MKKILALSFSVLFLLIASTPAYSNGFPEMRGTWKGKAFLNKSGKFLVGNAVIVINKQDGQLFSGYKLWFSKKTDIAQKEEFSGIFDSDGVHFYIAENEDGYTFGSLTSKQTMDLYYLENGRKAKAIAYQLERIHFTKAFVEIDTNGDNAVLRAEIKHFYPLNAERIMREADMNKDGKLTKSEWEKWKTNNRDFMK